MFTYRYQNKKSREKIRNAKKRNLDPEKINPIYWLKIRYQVLKDSDGRCQLCGESKHDGAILHIDHIKPKRLFPELALDKSNLQVLCRNCNVGKSTSDSTDWRSKKGSS